MNGLFQMVQGVVPIALNRVCRRQSVEHVVGFGVELQRMLQMLDRGRHLAPIQFGDADIIVIVSGSEHRPLVFVKLLFTSVNKDLRPFLNLGLFGMLRNQIFERTDSSSKIFRVHQLDSGLVCLDGVGEMLGSGSRRSSRTRRSDG